MFRIANKNKLKLTYNCCRNIGLITAFSNRGFNQQSYHNHGSSFKKGAECLLDNNCLAANIVYKVVVSTPGKPDKKYFGIAETAFKECFRNHIRGFRHKMYVNNTDLSKYM